MSHKDKRGNKKDGSKQTSKQEGLAVKAAAVNTRPGNFGFLWSIDSVIPNHEKAPDLLNVGPAKGNNIARLWFPPTYANKFRRTRRGKLYRWRMGGSELADDIERPKAKFDIASIFFQARQDNFVVTNFNCVRDDIETQSHGWGYVQFNHLKGNVSQVDFVGSEFGLAAPAPDSTWMPQVLPEVYGYKTRAPSVRESPGKSGGLCGKLALLIGIAAFSAEETVAEAVVSQCFSLGIWKNHQYDIGIGRYQDRGVIVSIYLDPTAEGVTKDHLKAFERGDYGPIWDYRPIPQKTCTCKTTYTTEPSAVSRLDTSARSIPRNAEPVTYGTYASAQPSAASYTPTAQSPYPTLARRFDSSSEVARGDDDDEEPEADIYSSS